MTSALTGAGSTRSWRRLRRVILARDGYSCQVPVDGTDRLCGAYATHVDHVIRRRDGGSDHPANLRAACRDCNLAREHAQRQRRGTTARGWSW